MLARTPMEAKLPRAARFIHDEAIFTMWVDNIAMNPLHICSFVSSHNSLARREH